MLGSEEPTGFLGWITVYGQYVAFFVQLVYWVILSAVAIWATLLFRKLVNAKVARIEGRGAAEVAGAIPAPATGLDTTEAQKPSIDEFVD